MKCEKSLKHTEWKLQGDEELCSFLQGCSLLCGYHWPLPLHLSWPLPCISPGKGVGHTKLSMVFPSGPLTLPGHSASPTPAGGCCCCWSFIGTFNLIINAVGGQDGIDCECSSCYPERPSPARQQCTCSTGDYCLESIMLIKLGGRDIISFSFPDILSGITNCLLQINALHPTFPSGPGRL